MGVYISQKDKINALKGETFKATFYPLFFGFGKKKVGSYRVIGGCTEKEWGRVREYVAELLENGDLTAAIVLDVDLAPNVEEQREEKDKKPSEQPNTVLKEEFEVVYEDDFQGGLFEVRKFGATDFRVFSNRSKKYFSKKSPQARKVLKNFKTESND